MDMAPVCRRAWQSERYERDAPVAALPGLYWRPVASAQQVLHYQRPHVHAALLVASRSPVQAPWPARRSMERRATRMKCQAPVRTGGAVVAGWDRN